MPCGIKENTFASNCTGSLAHVREKGGVLRVAPVVSVVWTDTTLNRKTYSHCDDCCANMDRNSCIRCRSSES